MAINEVMGVNINATDRHDPDDQGPPRLDILAIAKANHATYLTLTSNTFEIELGKTTAFDVERLKVIIGAEQLSRLGVTSPEELHFIVLHELGHLKEFRDDPAAFKALLKTCKQHPDGKSHFALYNSLMDIYVNHNTANKAATFSDGHGGFSELVKALYLTKAFPQHDLSAHPLSDQYAIQLLLIGMGVARAYTVSEPIREILDAGLTFCGQHYTYDELIQAFLVPAIGTHKSALWQGTIGQRETVIKATILPIFQELLEQDKKNQRDVGDLSKLRELGLEPAGLDCRGRSQGSNITHTFSPEDIEKLIGAIMRIAQRENMSSEERARHDLHRQATQIAQAAGTRNASDFADRLVRVQPVVNTLVNEFLNLRSYSKKQPRALYNYSTEGVLHVPETITKFGKIQTDPSNAEVMRREKNVHGIENAPVNLRLCLTPDLSTSMSRCIDGLKDNVIALAAAVATLCSIHKRRNSGLVSELAIYGFDHRLHEILDPIPDASLRHVAAAYERITTLGGTYEHLALEHLISLLDRLTKEDKRKGPSRKTLTIAISLTDGDTEKPAQSIAAKEGLLRRGIECFGVFLRGSGSNGETFRKIWGDRGYEIDAVEQLPKPIAEIRARINQG